MIVKTKSGTRYEFDGLKMRRISDASLRRDGEWVELLSEPRPFVGESMFLTLEPLATDADVTMRITTPVVSIEETE